MGRAEYRIWRWECADIDLAGRWGEELTAVRSKRGKFQF